MPLQSITKAAQGWLLPRVAVSIEVRLYERLCLPTVHTNQRLKAIESMLIKHRGHHV